MFKIREVKKVGYSKFNECLAITYKDDDGMDKFAACVDDIFPKCGDIVEIYTDDYINYKGFGAMTLKIM